VAGLDDDPEVQELRERIAANDRAVVDAVNRRLELVAELKALKDARGYDYVDRSREDRLLALLAETNAGPLSDEGLRDLVTALIALTKREVGMTPAREPA
jgi:chorismate mutase